MLSAVGVITLEKIFMFSFFFGIGPCLVMSKVACISFKDGGKASVVYNRTSWVSLSHSSLVVELGGPMPTKLFW